MLQGEAREIAQLLPKSKRPDPPIIKIEPTRINNYSDLIYGIVSELGFLVPETKYENDSLKRKYQPSLKYLECLKDLKSLFGKIMDDSFDIFDILRCRIGEWKFMFSHFLPLLIHLINETPTGNNGIFLTIEIIDMLIFCIDEDDQLKSAYYYDLVHHNCIYKKHFSDKSVMGALTKLLASSLSSNSNNKLNYDPLRLIVRLLKNILLSPEADSSKGNLILNLSYGRKENVISSMFSSKMCDIIFSIASSIDNRDLFDRNNPDIPTIFQDVFGIIALTFENLDLSQFISSESRPSKSMENNNQSYKKPIRHGRFAGSVSVQLSTGESIVINNTKMFVAGIPGSLDMKMRKNGKLEGKISSHVYKRINLSNEQRKLFLTLSIQFLESHFNSLFHSITEERTVFDITEKHRKYLMQIVSYFMEFCRISSADTKKTDYYKLLYGMLNSKFLLANIDYLHELISSKNYPNILKLMPFFKELLLLVLQFSNSEDELRRSVSKNIQNQLLHSKNVLLLVRRVIIIAKPLTKYFLHLCIECNDVLFKLTKKYSQYHSYWHVSSLSCAAIYQKDNELDLQEFFNMGQESNFNFETLIKYYSSRDVVGFYCQCLLNCQYEPSEINNMVARYLYFLVKSDSFYKSLMRPSIVVQLQNVIAAPDSWKNNNNDLIISSKKIIRKFSLLIKSDPSNLVLSFFS